jgi:hypothetical protein
VIDVLMSDNYAFKVFYSQSSLGQSRLELVHRSRPVHPDIDKRQRIVANKPAADTTFVERSREEDPLNAGLRY